MSLGVPGEEPQLELHPLAVLTGVYARTGRTHDDVAQAVSVGVARRAHRLSKHSPKLVGVLDPVPIARQAHGRPEIDAGAAPVDVPVVPLWRAHDDVREAVAVDVAGCGDRGSEVGLLVLAVGVPVVGLADAVGRAVPDLDPALLIDVGRVEGCADDDVAIAVPVNVARRGHGHPKRAPACALFLVQIGTWSRPVAQPG